MYTNTDLQEEENLFQKNLFGALKMDPDTTQSKKPRRSLHEDTSHQRNRQLPSSSSSSTATSNNGTFVVPNGRSSSQSSTNLDASAIVRQIDDATSSNLSLFRNTRKVIGFLYFFCMFFVPVF